MSDMGGQAGLSKKIVSLLRLFAEGPESLSIQEISTALTIAPSTVHRLLSSLVEEKLVERTAKRRYCVGREFSRIGAMAARRMNARRIARQMLQNLHTATGETSIFAVVTSKPPELMIADKLDSIHTLRFSIAANVRRQIVWGALGKAALAWLEPEDVAAALACARHAPGTGDPPPSPEALNAALVRVRERGYAISSGESIAGAIGIAAPVFDADNRLIGDLGVIIPAIRFRRRDETALADLVIKQSRQLSAALGSDVANGIQKIPYSM
jgi:DNA-binding IclR family transcriptional regulator